MKTSLGAMKGMASTEFRKRYAQLKEPVTVTVNGHPIGVWMPGDEEPPPPIWNPQTRQMDHLSQAQRDALLRKINKPKG